MSQLATRPEETFKACSCCGWIWWTREEFLEDPEVTPIGYMAHWQEPGLGLFNFNHELCGTTLAVRAYRFSDLTDDPHPAGRKVDSPECPGHCLHARDLDPCGAACEGAHIREALDVIARWPKASPLLALA